MSFEEIAQELTKNGYSITKQSVHMWASGERKPDITKPNHLKALSKVLRVSESELLAALTGYEPLETLSREARYVAEIVDSMPPEKRRLAVKILQGMAEG